MLVVALLVVFGLPIFGRFLTWGEAFLFAHPAWMIVTASILGGAYWLLGAKGVYGGSMVLVAAVYLHMAAPDISESIRCSRPPAQLERAEAKSPTRIIFDGLTSGGMFVLFKGDHDPVRATAALSNAEVIEIERLERRYIGEVWSTKLTPLDACPSDGRAIRTAGAPGGGDEYEKLDVCLTRTKIHDFRQTLVRELALEDKGPAIYFIANDGAGIGVRTCGILDVVERNQGRERGLGRVVVDYRDWNPRPDPRGLSEARKSWFLAAVRNVLGDHVSEEALKPHLVP